MKYIPLTQDKFAIVDDEDYDFLMQWKWFAQFNWNKTGFYARRREGKRKIYMHRVIMKTPPNKYTDHINHISHDNRKCNMRICTNKENQENRQVHIFGKTSKYRGVSLENKKYVACIKHNDKKIRLGRYDIETDAAHAYDSAAKQLYGNVVCLNFP